jgi:zinc transport system ATP-binding protein
MTPILRIEQGTVAFGGRPVLRDLNLTVQTREVVAILGANGSGKSTLIRAALGLVPLASGSVELFGVPQRRFRDWRRIGYVPQRLGAGSGVPATLREVVTAGRLAKRGFLRPARSGDRAAVNRAIELVGLGERARTPVSVLSGGQQQRTLIARALAGEPDLLVLDEPTAGVDAASQEAFAGALERFVEGGGTVILVAHELGPLQPIITRAVALHDGVIAHDGPVPRPAGHHAHPDHDHVHPHAPDEEPGIWGTR